VRKEQLVNLLKLSSSAPLVLRRSYRMIIAPVPQLRKVLAMARTTPP